MTDVALERPDLDESRTAAMGGSFGGYMANWVAGHTDRFRAIVTHASLWALDQFGPTTDASWYWAREMTPEMREKSDPSRHVDNIVTPMLVIHGDKDYRVPIGEGLRLWQELNARAEDPATMPHRFLYFPDENHWVLKPGNAEVWYETVHRLPRPARPRRGRDRPRAAAVAAPLLADEGGDEKAESQAHEEHTGDGVWTLGKVGPVAEHESAEHGQQSSAHHAQSRAKMLAASIPPPLRRAVRPAARVVGW